MPHVAGDQAEGREHGRGRTDRAMHRVEQQCVEQVAAGCADDNCEPCDTRTEQAPGKQAEQGAEHQVAKQVLQARMQGERRDQSPPFA